MTDGQGEPDVDLNRAHASRALERIRRHEIFAAEQVASMAKWLTASLLAVNGGGAIAVFNHPHTAGHAWCAGIAFMLGIAFALLSGTGLQEFYNRVSDPLYELDKYWTRVSLTGVRDEAEEASLKQPVDKIHRLAFIPPMLGWISGVSFLVGAVLLAT